MEVISVDGMIILRCIFTVGGCSGIDWNDLAQDRDN
jgi:hypothetical protein